jgi:HK97 family phage major capsid protein
MEHALLNPRRARGLVGVRADAGDATKILNELKTAFEAFKDANDQRIKGVEKKFDDVVQNEKVDRINADIGKLQTALDEINAAVAAGKIGGAGNDGLNAEQREHAKAFDRFFRKGVENGLRELEVKAAASTSSDPDGGYVTPKQTEATIDRVLGTVSAMRQIARVISISAGTYKKLIGQGGATSGWVGEKESRSETNSPTLAALEFPAMELYANPAATQTLLDDASVNIEQWLADEVAIEFAEEEGTAFISGNGINKPRGILDYTTVANASYAWGKLGYIATGSAADFDTEDSADELIDLTMALKQGYRQNARWLMNRTVQGKVRKFKDDQDNYLWQPGIQAGQPATLLGYPITDDDNMSDVGANAYPVAFGDFQRGYLIVDRSGIRVLRDPYTNKPYVMFYTTKRVGGGVQNFEAIKLLKCASS